MKSNIAYVGFCRIARSTKKEISYTPYFPLSTRAMRSTTPSTGSKEEYRVIILQTTLKS
jgi:hypothetical protein